MDEKEKIINFSRDKFFKRGFYKITMDEIASSLRISKKTIYKYFPSKGNLVDEVVRIFQYDIKKRLNKIVNEHDNSILKIKALTNFLAELSLEIDEKMMYDLQTHRPDLWERIDDFRSKVIKEVWPNIINTGKKEKCIIDKPNDIIISIIISSVRGVLNPTFLVNHNYSIKEAFRLTFDILIMGILTPKGLEIYNKLEQGRENGKN